MAEAMKSIVDNFEVGTAKSVRGKFKIRQGE